VPSGFLATTLVARAGDARAVFQFDFDQIPSQAADVTAGDKQPRPGKKLRNRSPAKLHAKYCSTEHLVFSTPKSQDTPLLAYAALARIIKAYFAECIFLKAFGYYK